jgi:hypothetical protein
MDVRHLDPVDAAEAVKLGQFVELAYAMYAGANGNPAPQPPSHLPYGYKFAAWVQMRDFIFESDQLTFYGLMAANPDGSDVILAIRGTQTLEEWWDDLTSLYPVDWAGPGKVGFGFDAIYQTMTVVPYPATAPAAAAERLARASGPPRPFARQVADLVAKLPKPARKGGKKTAAQPPAGPPPVRVTGHSLGSALATLYVLENVSEGKANVPLLCTFASPLVGDSDFVAGFTALKNLQSWRIVNALDVVPKLPIDDFVPVPTLYEYNSGFETLPTPGCWHSLDTYLHLLDSSKPISSGCRFLAGAMRTTEVLTRATPLAAAGQGIAVAAPPKAAVSVTGDRATGVTVTVKIELS